VFVAGVRVWQPEIPTIKANSATARERAVRSARVFLCTSSLTEEWSSREVQQDRWNADSAWPNADDARVAPHQFSGFSI
jgi:hypothetical protein